MRKTRLIAALVIVLVMLSGRSYAAQPLVELRGKIVREANDLKGLMSTSKDVYLVSSMWDTCMLTMNQLDAYFSMVGIFNTIRKDQVTKEAVAYLDGWLTEIMRVNDLNIKSLSGTKSAIDPLTKIHMDMLVRNFNDLNKAVTAERARIVSYGQTVRK
jgi:hypothetical protein